MLRSSLMVLGAITLTVLVYGAPVNAAARNAEGFIRDTGNKAFASLSEEGISQGERTKRFKELLEEAFDLPRIARFTLGRYWRVATDTEKREYISLFKKFVIQAYTKRFQTSAQEIPCFAIARRVSARALVLTEIVIPNQPAIKINWRSARKTTNTRLPMLWSKASDERHSA